MPDSLVIPPYIPITGRAHGVAETVALAGDPIAVLLHLLTEVFQVVPTRVCGTGRSRVAPCRGRGRRVRVGARGGQKRTRQRKIEARCDGAETEIARHRDVPQCRLSQTSIGRSARRRRSSVISGSKLRQRRKILRDPEARRFSLPSAPQNGSDRGAFPLDLYACSLLVLKSDNRIAGFYIGVESGS